MTVISPLLFTLNSQAINYIAPASDEMIKGIKENNLHIFNAF